MWTPWSQSNAFTLLASAHERTVLDLKEAYDLSKPETRFEIAKDMAAFANAFGGTILVGTIEGRDSSGRKTGRVTAIKDLGNAGPLIKQATESARDFCRPQLVVTPEEIRLTAAEASTLLGRAQPSDVLLIALNVSALLSGPAGVFAVAKDGSKTADAFRFPVRVGEGTKLLMPEELAFYMNSHERRVLLQLQRLPEQGRVRIWMKAQGPDKLKPARNFRVAKLDPELQIVVVQPTDGSNTLTEGHIPFAFIRAIWRDERGGWNIDVDGSVCEYGAMDGFIPRGGSS